ncbi:hypothetical protein IAD21_03757 [Abditibacteriota bacterium]|nr:hypothetical protein IAD21_03757 [Abditibacteriota bacterium]
MKRYLFAFALVLPCGLACAATPTPQATLPSYQVAPRIKPQLQPFSLSDVRLLDGPFKHAQQLDLQYMLSLEPDRFLHNFRTNAGLAAKAPIYGGWESAGVGGQTLGHYLSALAMMYQSTGDARIKAKLDYTVSELAVCQAQSPDGYTSGIPDGRAMFNDVKAGKGNGIHRGWVPWYTMHKLFAGLRDAYLLTGNTQAKEVLVKLGDWEIDTTKNLSDEQWQVMMQDEHGGMAETMADLYALTGETKYLDSAKHWTHHQVFDPASQEKDALTGFHANTQIPKFIGYERIYDLTGDPAYGKAADFFWRTVVTNRTYAIGGNSDHEHFFNPADTKAHLSGETAENCNVYNMLKLTRELYEDTPAQAKWMNYYERALFNQILSSQDPIKGGFNYLNSLKPGGFKVYSNPTTAFWCCVGTGMENHSKYGDTIYFHDANSLYVNLFIASTLNWHDKGVTITQNTRFPDEDTTRFTIGAAKPVQFALKLRQPEWTSGAKLIINGKMQKVVAGEYATVNRTWKNGDVVSWQLPMKFHSEALTDAPKQRALLYGPIVLAADLGREGLDKISDYVDNQTIYSNYPAPDVPSLVSNTDFSTSDAWAKSLKRAPGQDLAFTLADLPRNTNGTMATLRLIPFARAQHIRYNVYWNTLTPNEFKAQQTKLAEEQARQRELAARTLDEFRPNEQQSEQDHALKSEKSNAGNFGNTAWRDANDGGFFEFDLKTQPDAPQDLLVTYWGSDTGNRHFDILVNGQKIASQTLNNSKPNEFLDVTYPIPTELTQGKSKVTVRFQAQPGAMAGGVFGTRMIKRQ